MPLIFMTDNSKKQCDKESVEQKTSPLWPFSELLGQEQKHTFTGEPLKHDGGLFLCSEGQGKDPPRERSLWKG